MNRVNLHKAGGEIFIPPVKKRKTPVHWLKTASIVSLMLIVVVAVNIFVAAWNQPAKDTALKKEPITTAPQAQLANHESGPTFRPINTGPIAMPSFTPINPNGGFNGGFNGTGDINAAASQINQMQNQIVAQMNACVQIVNQASNQIGQMRAQQQQIDIAIQEVNRAMNNVNPQDPNAPAIRDQLRYQRDQLYFQRNQLQNAISTARTQAGRARSDCFTSVQRMQTQKRNAEGQLQISWQRSMNVNF